MSLRRPFAKGSPQVLRSVPTRVLPCFLSMRPVVSRCRPSKPFLAILHSSAEPILASYHGGAQACRWRGHSLQYRRSRLQVLPRQKRELRKVGTGLASCAIVETESSVTIEDREMHAFSV